MAKFSVILCSVILCGLHHTEASPQIGNQDNARQKVFSTVTTESRDNYQVDIINGNIPAYSRYRVLYDQHTHEEWVYRDVKGGTRWYNGQGSASAVISGGNHSVTLTWEVPPGVSATYSYVVYKTPSSAPAALHGVGLASSILVVALLDVFRRISV